MDQLKSVAIQQTAHIKAQTNLINEYKNQLLLKDSTIDRICRRKDKEREKIEQLIVEEVPLLTKTLVQGKDNLASYQTKRMEDDKDIRDLRQVGEMKACKIKILQEELEKALQ